MFVDYESRECHEVRGRVPMSEDQRRSVFPFLKRRVVATIRPSSGLVPQIVDNRPVVHGGSSNASLASVGWVVVSCWFWRRATPEQRRELFHRVGNSPHHRHSWGRFSTCLSNLVGQVCNLPGNTKNAGSSRNKAATTILPKTNQPRWRTLGNTTGMARFIACRAG